jgi:hypothetical protein
LRCYLVDAARVAPYFQQTGLRPALFDGRACVSFNFQSYTGQFPGGSGLTQEIELNVIAYPAQQASFAAQVSFEQFIIGDEQSKILGNRRIHVPCDADMAIAAGIKCFGEPKFKTSFTTSLPSLNDPTVTTWQVVCQDPVDAAVAIFTAEADLRGLTSVAANLSPQTEFGQVGGRLIGCRWNILQPYQAYLLSGAEAKRVTMLLGESTHPMKADMAALIGDAPAAAVRTFQSAPVAIQSRAYYI